MFLAVDKSPGCAPSSAGKLELHLVTDQRQIQPTYEAGRGIRLSNVFDIYELSTKDRITLAHSIVLAYWQLYDSELTRAGWTSDTIYLMYQKDEVKGSYSLPLISYLTFPFDTVWASESTPQKRNHAAVHSYPDILSIGTILLEIALSKVMPPESSEHLSDTSRTNARLRTAAAHLDFLKTQTWENFKHKGYFETAVEGCLNFMGIQEQHTTAQRYKEMTPREIFYQKVVCPLAYLAKSGFKAQRGGHARRKEQHKKRLEKQRALPDGPDGALHTGLSLNTGSWLEDLKSICRNLEVERRRQGIKDRIRVAILDTGCELSLVPSKSPLKVDWRDFLDDSNTPQDLYGHGTLMTRLILECSPNATVIVARIAKDVDGLQDNQSKVAEVRQIYLLMKARESG